MKNEGQWKAKLSEFARKCIQEYLDENNMEEATGTGAVAPISTPLAFQGNDKHNVERKKRISQGMGFKLTKQGKIDLKHSADKLEHVTIRAIAQVTTLTENVTRDLVKSPKPHQKIGRAVSQIHKQLKEVEKLVIRQRKLKVKENVSPAKFWKRTLGQLGKLESRLISIAQEIRELKQ